MPRSLLSDDDNQFTKQFDSYMNNPVPMANSDKAAQCKALATRIFEYACAPEGDKITQKQIVSEKMATFSHQLHVKTRELEKFRAQIEIFQYIARLTLPLSDESDKHIRNLQKFVLFLFNLSGDDEVFRPFLTDVLYKDTKDTFMGTGTDQAKATFDDRVNDGQIIIAALLQAQRYKLLPPTASSAAQSDNWKQLSFSDLSEQTRNGQESRGPALTELHRKKRLSEALTDITALAKRLETNYIPVLETEISGQAQKIALMKESLKALRDELAAIAVQIGADSWKDALHGHQLSARYPGFEPMHYDRSSEPSLLSRQQTRRTGTRMQASTVSINEFSELGGELTRKPHAYTEISGNTYVLCHALNRPGKQSPSVSLERMAQFTAKHLSRVASGAASVESFKDNIDYYLGLALQEGLGKSRKKNPSSYLNATLTITKLFPSQHPDRTIAVSASRGECCTLAYIPSSKKLLTIVMPNDLTQSTVEAARKLPEAGQSIAANLARCDLQSREISNEAYLIQLSPQAWRTLQRAALDQGLPHFTSLVEARLSSLPVNGEFADSITATLSGHVSQIKNEHHQARYSHLAALSPHLDAYLAHNRKQHTDASQETKMSDFKGFCETELSKSTEELDSVSKAITFMLAEMDLSHTKLNKISFGDFYAVCVQVQKSDCDTAIQAFKAEPIGPAPHTILNRLTAEFQISHQKKKAESHLIFQCRTFCQEAFKENEPNKPFFLFVPTPEEKNHQAMRSAALKELDTLLEGGTDSADEMLLKFERRIITLAEEITNDQAAYRALVDILRKINAARHLYDAPENAVIKHTLWSSAALFHLKENNDDIAKFYARLSTEQDDFIGEFVKAYCELSDNEQAVDALFKGLPEDPKSQSQQYQIRYCRALYQAKALHALPAGQVKDKLIDEVRALTLQEEDASYPPMQFLHGATVLNLYFTDTLSDSASNKWIREAYKQLDNAKRNGHHRAALYLARMYSSPPPSDAVQVLPEVEKLAHRVQAADDPFNEFHLQFQMLNLARENCLIDASNADNQVLEHIINHCLIVNIDEIIQRETQNPYFFSYAVNKRHPNVSCEGAFAHIMQTEYDNEGLALHYAHKAAQSGDPMGWYLLASIAEKYELNDLVAVIHKHIVDSNDGSKQYDYVLSLMHEHGIGCPIDKVSAAISLRRAIDDLSSEPGLESARFHFATKQLDSHSTEYHLANSSLADRIRLADNLLKKAMGGGMVLAFRLMAQQIKRHAQVLSRDGSDEMVLALLRGSEGVTTEYDLTALGYLDDAEALLDVREEKADILQIIKTATDSLVEKAQQDQDRLLQAEAQAAETEREAHAAQKEPAQSLSDSTQTTPYRINISKDDSDANLFFSGPRRDGYNRSRSTSDPTDATRHSERLRMGLTEANSP